MKKGEFGYLQKKRAFSLLKSFLLLAAVVVVYYSALRHYQTNKNVFTILAAVGALPAGRSVVISVMLLRARSASADVRDAVLNVKGLSRDCSGYDICLTTEEKAFSLSHAAAGNGRLAGLTEDPAMDCAMCEKYILHTLDGAGLEGYSVRIYRDLREYIRALEELETSLDHDDRETDRKAMQLLYAVSL